MRSVRRLYDRVLGWAHSRYGTTALAEPSFMESILFPVPPDPLLMALSLSRPARALFYATVCSVAPVVGGVGGYLIGLFLFEAIGRPILAAHDAWAAGIAGFTPIPYKLFTVTAGALHISLAVFVIASAVSRSARFSLVTWLIHQSGHPIRTYIDRYFNLLTFVFFFLLIGGFVLLKWAS